MAHSPCVAEHQSVLQDFSLCLLLAFFSLSYRVSVGLVSALSCSLTKNHPFCGVYIPALWPISSYRRYDLLDYVFFWDRALPQSPHTAVVCHARLQPHNFSTIYSCELVEARTHISPIPPQPAVTPFAVPSSLFTPSSWSPKSEQ